MTAATNNKTSVLPDQSVPVIDRYRRFSSRWWNFIKPLLEATNQNSKDLHAVSADLTTAQAAITTESTVRADADGALAQQITTLTAAYQLADTTLSGSITNEATVRASADGALAQQISTVSTTVNDNTFSIQQLTESVDGYAGKWSLSLNANGRVKGSITLNGNQEKTELGILADKFIIVHPTADGTTIQAFVVGLVNGVSTVGINGNLLVDGTILARMIAAGAITTDKLAAGSVTAAKIAVSELAALSADLGTVTAGRIQSADGKSFWDLDSGEQVIGAP